MNQSGVAIDGLEELQAFLKDELPREAIKLTRQAMRAVASDVAKEMKTRVPVDTGTLKKAIHVRSNRVRNDRISADVRIKTGHDKGAKKTGQGRTGYGVDAFYWRFIEYGTVNRPARPFRTPAVEAMRPRIPGLLRKHIAAKLEKLKVKRGKVRV